MTWKQVLYLVLVLLLVAVQERPSQSQGVTSTPRSCVQSFASAVNRGSLADAAACVANAKPKTSGLAMLWQGMASQKIQYTVNFKKITVSKNKAIVDLTTTAKLSGSSLTRTEKLTLKRFSKGWRIIPLKYDIYRTANVGFLTEKASLLAFPEQSLSVFQRAYSIARANQAKKKSRK